jgi:hypothetical protein
MVKKGELPDEAWARITHRCCRKTDDAPASGATTARW